MKEEGRRKKEETRGKSFTLPAFYYLSERQEQNN
jgi:hypothetical protein